MDNDDLLRRLGRGVASLHHLTQRHGLVGGNEGVKDICAPASAVFHQQLLRRVLALHKAVEDAHSVCERRAADLNDGGIQAEQHSPFQDSEADVVGNDDAAAALQHVLDSLLEQGRLSEASH